MKLLLLLSLLTSWAFASDDVIVLTENNTLIMNDQFDESSVAKVQADALKLSMKTKGDIYLILNTPGGSVGAGKELIQFLQALPNKIHTITLYAASMGYNTAQALGTRYILPSGILMSHRAHIRGLSGQIPGEVETRISFLKEYISDLEETAAKRVGISVETYTNLVLNEYWVTGANAVKAGHADKVILAKCDESLSGTYVEKFNTMFGPVWVTFSKCPIISGFLDVKFGDGSNVFPAKARQSILERLSFKHKYYFGL